MNIAAASINTQHVDRFSCEACLARHYWRGELCDEFQAKGRCRAAALVKLIEVECEKGYQSLTGIEFGVLSPVAELYRNPGT